MSPLWQWPYLDIVGGVICRCPNSFQWPEGLKLEFVKDEGLRCRPVNSRGEEASNEVGMGFPNRRILKGKGRSDCCFLEINSNSTVADDEIERGRAIRVLGKIVDAPGEWRSGTGTPV
jgi:hypothetical protein